MPARSSESMRKVAYGLSVCTSVCLSVKRVHCNKSFFTDEKICPYFFIPHERPFSLVFWKRNRWWEWRTPSTWNFGSIPKQLGLESSWLRRFGVPFTDGLSTSTIYDNQPAEAGDRHWVGQTVAAFHWFISQWRRRIECRASSSSKADTLNIWCKTAECDSY